MLPTCIQIIIHRPPFPGWSQFQIVECERLFTNLPNSRTPGLRCSPRFQISSSHKWRAQNSTFPGPSTISRANFRNGAALKDFAPDLSVESTTNTTATTTSSRPHLRFRASWFAPSSLSTSIAGLGQRSQNLGLSRMQPFGLEPVSIFVGPRDDQVRVTVTIWRGRLKPREIANLPRCQGEVSCITTLAENIWKLIISVTFAKGGGAVSCRVLEKRVGPGRGGAGRRQHRDQRRLGRG